MYELIVLSFLARWTMHGYKIAKIINDMIGPYARLSNGRLYPLLTTLEKDGLIALTDVATDATDATDATARGGRRQRAYSITVAGRRRFHELMMDTTSNQGEYARIFWYKIPCLYLLELHERLYLLDHYITYCQTHIFHVQAEMEDLRRHAAQYWVGLPEQGEATLYAMEQVLQRWRLELESVMKWRTHVVALAEGTEQAHVAQGEDRYSPENDRRGIDAG